MPHTGHMNTNTDTEFTADDVLDAPVYVLFVTNHGTYPHTTRIPLAIATMDEAEEVVMLGFDSPFYADCTFTILTAHFPPM